MASCTTPKNKLPDQFTDSKTEALCSKALSIVVLGASGDLAKKKTFPALFALYCHDLLPDHCTITGYARSKLKLADFHARISPGCQKAYKKDDNGELLAAFLKKTTYVQGQYDSSEDFTRLHVILEEKEAANGGPEANRMFYLALPPSVFASVARAFQPVAFTSSGWNRVIVEKPFGRDSKTSKELVSGLADVLEEHEQYRIDHYLGKEMVQNLLALRFANMIFMPIWNRDSIANVKITFKEPFGTDGRGGYFDNIGIVRDVMQNHLLQVLSIVAMERPINLDAESVRDEKVKVLRCIPPIDLEDCVLGQYGKSEDGTKPSYLDDDTVPPGSKCCTFAQAVMWIKNERWDGVPFIMKAGKALETRQANIRIQFRDVPGQLFPNAARNELVITIQPNEGIYCKIMAKEPGLSTTAAQTELDLTYGERYKGTMMPEAYERLILDVLRGDHSQFVRDDELEAAWKIFTPLLQRIEDEGVQPEIYPYGSRGPPSADQQANDLGVNRDLGYKWFKSNAGADLPQ